MYKLSVTKDRYRQYTEGWNKLKIAFLIVFVFLWFAYVWDYAIGVVGKQHLFNVPTLG